MCQLVLELLHSTQLLKVNYRCVQNAGKIYPSQQVSDTRSFCRNERSLVLCHGNHTIPFVSGWLRRTVTLCTVHDCFLPVCLAYDLLLLWSWEGLSYLDSVIIWYDLLSSLCSKWVVTTMRFGSLMHLWLATLVNTVTFNLATSMILNTHWWKGCVNMYIH